MKSFYTPESVMVIVAHPDDIEYTCAGTIARWVKNGARAAYVICTSGDVGIAEAGMTREKAARIREAEQNAAALITGVRDVVYLREPDGLLTPTLELRKKIVREIRRFKPEVVIADDPTVYWGSENYINHPDHRAAAQAALDAVFPASGQPNLFEDLAAEGLQAHKVRKVYVMDWGNKPSEYISIDETIEVKISALSAHKSQVKEDPAAMIKEWASGIAKGKEMAYAEAYRVFTLVDDENWEKTKGGVEV